MAPAPDVSWAASLYAGVQRRPGGSKDRSALSCRAVPGKHLVPATLATGSALIQTASIRLWDGRINQERPSIRP